MQDICKFHSLDSVWTVCNRAGADAIRNLLSYQEILWVPGRYGKKKMKRKKYLVTSQGPDDHYFLTGFMSRVLSFLKEHKIPYQYKSDIPVVEFDDPKLDGIEFRGYQDNLIWKALETGRGVLKSPTGSGKSIIILGIMSAFSQERILFLVHTVDLVQQMKEHLEKNGFKDEVGMWAGGEKSFNRITVATVQSYSRLKKDEAPIWDVVIVDEGHHVTNPEDGMYFNVLARIGAPVKLAVTATLADSEEAQLALEGLVGPVIGELTMAEGAELGFLAKPKIYMPVIKASSDVADMKKYPSAYKWGIVKNVTRNAWICAEAEKSMALGGSILILVSRIEHIDEIQKSMDFPAAVVKGAVDKETRERIKKELIRGDIQCVVATTAWVEGVDIPNLTCVINAGGMKSERETLQKIGRGLRKTETKSSVTIIDFYDKGNKHLERHSKQRLAIYKEQGWEVREL